MNAVVVTMEIDPSRYDEVDRHLREDVVSWARRQPGFVSGQWLRLDGGDRAMGLVMFESAAQAAAAAEGPRSQPTVEGRAWNTQSVSVFEVVAEA